MPSKEAPTAREIADELLDRIASGDLESGEKLPSTRELAELHEVGEKTIYRVISLLKASGQVEGRQGKGVFVRAIKPLEWQLHQFERGDRRDDSTSGRDDWKAAAAEQGRTPSQDTPRVSVEPAPPEVAAWLGLKPGTFVVARRRVRRVDGEPFQLADSWFPTGIALDTDLMREEDVTRPGGILAYIGHPQKRLRDEIRSWPPATQEEAQRLELPEGVGTPVTRHARIGYDEAGDPIRVMVTVAPGHLNTLVYELEV
ncbi:GntR family transcriptional regulator [Streptomyces reniochalinae]|uniref:GntR family transcriptional regulator n=1 Tax=Streptomyces reniochalinae TaxID=2250578 RepID=A0A367E931_9ACTN|nr:GntR family transcriptional regulator [Streptomyces reniochalinae]RCG14175.1 GntR family transcriptional regulator [Streptomyces reniochalinae]